MKPLTRHLVNYAHYHRDPRNIRTHFVGIPMIVVAVACLLALLPLPLPGGLTAAHLITLAVIATSILTKRAEVEREKAERAAFAAGG